MSDQFWVSEMTRLGIKNTEDVNPETASDDALLAAWHCATFKAEDTDNWDEVARLEPEIMRRELH